MGQRFNWQSWEVVGDIYRKDDDIACASSTGTSGTSGTSPSGSPSTSGSSLTGCAAAMPPRIDSFNIIESSQVEIYIYGDGII